RSAAHRLLPGPGHVAEEQLRAVDDRGPGRRLLRALTGAEKDKAEELDGAPPLPVRFTRTCRRDWLLLLALLRRLLRRGLLRRGLLGGRLLRRRLALAAADLAGLARDVAVRVEEVDVLRVVHLDPGGGDLRLLALRLSRLLPGHRPDVALLDVI